MTLSETRPQKLFSVIIPFHNQGSHLIDAVESVLRQTVGFAENIEIILADNASSDISPYIAKHYSEQYPDSIIYHRTEPCTPEKTVKTGTDLASGKFRLLLHADDVLADDALEAVRQAALSRENAAFVLSTEDIETGAPLMFHPIRNSGSLAEFSAAEFKAGCSLLEPDPGMVARICVYPAESRDPAVYVYVPQAVLKMRRPYHVPAYDPADFTIGEPQNPPYTAENVRNSLLPENAAAGIRPLPADTSREKFEFSLVMYVSNAHENLENAVQSILGQDIGFAEHVQLILVDDGSVDSSGMVCDRFRKAWPKNIIVLHQQHYGRSFSRYAGAQHAEGKIINFCDAEGSFSANTLRAVRGYFRKNEKVDIAAVPLFLTDAANRSHPGNSRFRDHTRTADLAEDFTGAQTVLQSMFLRKTLLTAMRCDVDDAYFEGSFQAALFQLISPRLGLIPECGYYSEPDVLDTGACPDTITEDRDFYLSSIKNYLLPLVRIARKKCGFVPRFIQYLVFSELRFRFDPACRPGSFMSPDDCIEYEKLLPIALSAVDREVIESPAIDIPGTLRNLCHIGKANGLFDLYPVYGNGHADPGLIESCFEGNVPSEFIDETWSWICGRMGLQNALSALREYKKGWDPAGNPPAEDIADFQSVFQYHSSDSAVRIWRNEIPDRFSESAYRWMCARYGSDEITASLQRLLTRLKPPAQSLFNAAEEHGAAAHRTGVAGKFGEFQKKAAQDGLIPTAVEYGNNLFYYQHRLLKNKLTVPERFNRRGSRPNRPAAQSRNGYTYDPVILFESAPDLSDNAYPVYRYLLEKGVNERYQLVWAMEKPELFSGIREKNVSYVVQKTDEMYRLKKRAAAMVSCNRFIFANPAPGQISLFLTHGSPLKASPLYSYLSRFNYVLSQSEWLKPYVSYENDTPLENLYVLGIPRNDALFHPVQALEKMGMDAYDKVVLWMPTYRNHKTASGETNHLQIKMNLGIPVLQSRDEAEHLNQMLKERNILLILKPHPAQDLSNLKEIDLSNFRIVYNADLEKKGVLLYELLGASGAMITDYSSVYYDYLLTGKPIGLTMDDFDTYNSARGFVYRDPYDILKGHHIRTLEDMEAFMTDLADGNDPFREERMRANDLCNTWQDDRSAQRVGDFLMDLLEK